MVADHLVDWLWEEPYDPDSLKVYRNVFDCWVGSEGDVEEPEYLDSLEQGTVPRYWFVMKVAIGTQ